MELFEGYKEDLVRYWDGIRTEHKGYESCLGVTCSDCMFKNFCSSTASPIYHLPEILGELIKWNKEHPAQTNREKFIEVFPELKDEAPTGCEMIGCHGNYCGNCPFNDFWERKYKG